MKLTRCRQKRAYANAYATYAICMREVRFQEKLQHSSTPTTPWDIHGEKVRKPIGTCAESVLRRFPNMPPGDHFWEAGNVNSIINHSSSQFSSSLQSVLRCFLWEWQVQTNRIVAPNAPISYSQKYGVVLEIYNLRVPPNNPK